MFLGLLSARRSATHRRRALFLASHWYDDMMGATLDMSGAF